MAKADGKDQSRDFILKTVQERRIKFVRLWFTDILGMLKSAAVVADELEEILDRGLTFDGGAIEGFSREEESDMIAMPDPTTLTVLPGAGDADHQVARMFCDILLPGGAPAPTDPRGVLRRQIKAAAAAGFTFYVGPEIEFFYFHHTEPGAPSVQPLDNGGYFDLTPLDLASPLRRKTALYLEEMEIGVDSSHHESAPSQHEIDLRYTDALSMADAVMTFRLLVREIAVENGLLATFMPKPRAGQNGSGMHINMSLFRGGNNAFHDPALPTTLSDTAGHFVAGLLRHARELTVFTNQWVNSYKRLVPGFEAPTRVTWALRNQADLVRIPAFKPGRENNRRVEYRSPDAACNPYLVFALLLAAGLRGIAEQLPLPSEHGSDEPCEVLPADLHEAIKAARGSTLAREVLGDILFEKFLDNKQLEWENYRSQVHQWELDRYLHLI